MEIEVNKTIKIHSYKHDKTIHRVWANAIALEISPNEVIVGNYKTRVIESNGRYWNTKEPAICFFYNNKWFNIIAMLKEDGIHYYCNISSPYLYDGEAIKYIDYDLDLRVDPNYRFKILDKDEYRLHAKTMGYSDKLKVILEDSLDQVIALVKERKGPFDHENVIKYFNQYKKLNTKVEEKENGETS